jgi:hypothetical protein
MPREVAQAVGEEEAEHSGSFTRNSKK